MKAYLLALFLDPITEGIEVSGSLPFHCTLVPWFTVESRLTDMIDALERNVGRCRYADLISVGSAMYGKDCTVPVHELEKTAELMSFHRFLLKTLEEFHVHHLDPQWVGDGWSPHVTDIGTRRFFQGLRSTVSVVTLVEANDVLDRTRKKILKKFRLSRQ
jgi:hypothetical protein